jgi:hypothetical protein
MSTGEAAPANRTSITEAVRIRREEAAPAMVVEDHAAVEVLQVHTEEDS